MNRRRPGAENQNVSVVPRPFPTRKRAGVARRRCRKNRAAKARSAGESRLDDGGLNAEPRLEIEPRRAAIAGTAVLLEPPAARGRLEAPAVPDEPFFPGDADDLELSPANFGTETLGVVADGVVILGVVTVAGTGPGTVTVTDGTVTGGTVTDGTETVGTGTDGAGTEGVGSDGVGRDGVGRDGAGSDGVDTDGRGRDGSVGPGSWADAVPVKS